jgi:Mycothiol maleylpyruvate isomerase N-terminal domain
VLVWTFEPEAVRCAYRSAAEALIAAGARVPADAWDRLGIGVWSVRELLGHASRALATVETYLNAANGPVTLTHPLDYYGAIADRADPDAVAVRGKEAGQALGDDPAGAVSTLARRILQRVDGEPDDAPVATPAGTMRLIDYLPSRVFELTVHRLDVARALGYVDEVEGPELAVSVVLAAGIASLGRDVPAVLLALTGRRPLPVPFSVV